MDLPASTSDTASTHAQRIEHSARLLESARDFAAKERGYNSQEVRDEIIRTFAEAFGGRVPYGWQVDVAEALLLGLDTAVIAGTGAGKTMPFVMPLLLDKAKTKMVIIISPLNELERDQARRFESMGLAATAINGEAYGKSLHNRVNAKAFRVLITSPEMCLEHPLFSTLIKNPAFMRDVLYLVIDEAHCVSQWGDSFRKKFSELCSMRSFVGGRKAFLLTSATLPPFMLRAVFTQLEFSESTTYLVNLGNDRPNITPIVHRLRAAQSSLPVLDFMTRDIRTGGKLTRTIIFFNTRDLAFSAYRYLRESVPEDVSTQIDFLHAGRGQRARRRVMCKFREGEVNILCATEAAGMGMDIPDIDISVQFLAASSLSVWMQRAGRAGRAGQPAMAILLVEPSIFQIKVPPSSKKAAPPPVHPDVIETSSDVEDGLHQDVSTARDGASTTTAPDAEKSATNGADATTDARTSTAGAQGTEDRGNGNRKKPTKSVKPTPNAKCTKNTAKGTSKKGTKGKGTKGKGTKGDGDETGATKARGEKDALAARDSAASERAGDARELLASEDSVGVGSVGHAEGMSLEARESAASADAPHAASNPKHWQGTKRSADGVPISPTTIPYFGNGTDGDVEMADANHDSALSPVVSSAEVISSGAIEYQKKAEDGMRSWADIQSCRREIADKYFDNPPRVAFGWPDQFPCCDNCIRQKVQSGLPLTQRERDVLRMIERITGSMDTGEEAADEEYEDELHDTTAEGDSEDVASPCTKDSSSHPASATPRPPGTRRGNHLLACRARLVRWRMQTWLRDYHMCRFSYLILLPDKTLTTLASQARLRTVADIEAAVPRWPFAADHGAEILTILSVVDERVRAEKEAKKKLSEEKKAAKAAQAAKKAGIPGGQKRRVRQRTEGDPFVMYAPPGGPVSPETFTPGTSAGAIPPLVWQVPQGPT
ncbi:P-loop containing nucleoside triphosphate hydrolase protein [Earliella scabrosa]|nr:P-loop containing nucleoside triphosphate hydrolase protein [Earliella scabrosa]